MRKIITALLLFISIHLYAQTYQWQPVGEGVRCSSNFEEHSAAGCFIPYPPSHCCFGFKPWAGLGGINSRKQIELFHYF